jgi:cell shape-determining protein MreC
MFACLGGVVALVTGYLVVQKRGEDAVTLKQTQDAKAASDLAAKKAQDDAKAADAAKADDDTKLTTATASITDLTTQLATAKQQATDAQTASQTANDAAKAAQAKVDAITTTLGGKTADELLAETTKAQSDLQAAQAEQKIIQDNLQQAQQQVADLTVAINNSKTGKMPPGVSGKVTFVDHAWNFVILDVGLSAGVVPNGELIVYRGKNFLGKVRVTKVDPNDAVAEIMPDIKGDIQVGDAVLN